MSDSAIIEGLNQQIDELSLIPLKDLDPYESVDILPMKDLNAMDVTNDYISNLNDLSDVEREIELEIKREMKEFKIQDTKLSKETEEFLLELEKNSKYDLGSYYDLNNSLLADRAVFRSNSIIAESESSKIAKFTSKAAKVSELTPETTDLNQGLSQFLTEFDSNPKYETTENQQKIKETELMNLLETLQNRVGKLEGERVVAKDKILELERELENTKRELNNKTQTFEYEKLLQEIKVLKQENWKSKRSPVLKDNWTDISLNFENTKEAKKSATTEAQPLETPIFTTSNPASKQQPKFKPSGTNTDFPLNINDFQIDQSFALSGDDIIQKSVYLDTTAATNDFDLKHLNELPVNDSAKEFENIKSEIEKQRKRVIATIPDTRVKNEFIESVVDRSKKPTNYPVWKKKERRKPDPVRKLGTHNRRCSPLTVPGIVEETGKRPMPFITGTSTGKSFSVTANLQKVYSMLKSHNPELCTVCSKRNVAEHECLKKDIRSRPELEKTEIRSKQDAKHKESKIKVPSSQVKAPSMPERHSRESLDTSESMRQMLGILELEYRECKAQYGSLVRQYEAVAETINSKQISEESGKKTLKAIGEDLKHCIHSMDAKTEQINIIQDIMASSAVLNQKKIDRMRENARKPVPIKGYAAETFNSLNRTKYTANKTEIPVNERKNQTPARAIASLSLLKSSLKVQDALENH